MYNAGEIGENQMTMIFKYFVLFFNVVEVTLYVC